MFSDSQPVRGGAAYIVASKGRNSNVSLHKHSIADILIAVCTKSCLAVLVWVFLSFAVQFAGVLGTDP